MKGVLRVLMLVLALTTAAGLRVVGGAAHATSRSSAVRMALPKVADARSLSTAEVEQEIAAAKKELFELRKKVKTRQQVKPHLFTHTKHRISQLQTLLSQRAA